MDASARRRHPAGIVATALAVAAIAVATTWAIGRERRGSDSLSTPSREVTLGPVSIGGLASSDESAVALLDPRTRT